MYYANYPDITQVALDDYSEIVQSRVKTLSLKSCFGVKNKAVDNILACYTIYLDQINFLAVNHLWQEVTWNHLLLNQN